MKLSIPDMSCGHCKATVEKTIAAVDPATEVAVDLASRSATVTGTTMTDAVLKALAAQGYPATVA